MTAVEGVLGRLEQVKLAGPDRWTARCPGHDDRSPSLSVWAGDHRVTFTCHAGCEEADVLAALGITLDDLRTSNPATGPQQVYDYTDAAGRLIFQVVRQRDKKFRQRRPDGNGGWAWNLQGVARMLYRLPAVLEAAAAGGTIFVVEGEKDVAAAETAGAAATCNPGGAGKWRDFYTDSLAGAARVVVVADRDEPGYQHARKVAASLEKAGISHEVVEPAEGKDLADHLAAGSTLDRLVPVPPPQPATAATAATPQVNAGFSVAPPDDVAAWGATELAVLLGDVEALYRRYVVFADDHQAVAVTLWTALSHVFDQFDVAPYIAVTSPEKRCGKSRVFDVAELLVARPWRAILPTEAVVFRKIARDRPTLLLDEVDAVFGPAAKEHEGLRAILNGGFAVGVKVPRCVGPTQQLVDFEVFCPKALAGIGQLPDTVADRSVPVRMRRKARHEKVDRFRGRVATQQAVPVRERLERWAPTADLRDARPDLPAELSDRAQDAWEPLLALADAAGNGWPSRARKAAVELHQAVPDEPSLGIRLLDDTRRVFGHADRLPTAELLRRLAALEEAPWSSMPGRGARAGKPLDPNGVARLLKPFNVEPTSIRMPDGTTPRGYYAGALRDVWRRYLPPPDDVAPQAATRSEGATENRPLTSDVAPVAAVAPMGGGTGPPSLWADLAAPADADAPDPDEDHAP